MKYLEHTITGERYLKSDSVALFPADTSDETMQMAWSFDDDSLATVEDVAEIKIYTIGLHQWDEEDSPQAEKVLAEMFWAATRDIGGQSLVDKYLNDHVMMNEEFNNWSYMLCRDGAICDDAYSDLAPDLEGFA